MLTLRLILFGASHADKTAFVKTVRDTPSEIEMAYATYVEGTYGHLYGSNDSYVISLLVAPPFYHPQRFFTWEVLAQSMNGGLLLVDADQPHQVEEAQLTLTTLKTHLEKHPLVIANTSPKSDAAQLRRALDTPLSILPCQVMDREASLQVLLHLLDSILKTSHA